MVDTTSRPGSKVIFAGYVLMFIVGLWAVIELVNDKQKPTPEPDEIHNYSIMTTNCKARFGIIIQDEDFKHIPELMYEKIQNGKSFILVKTDGVVYKASLTDVYRDPETEKYKEYSKIIECYTAYWGPQREEEFEE
tara:strand:+ start:234 stop:641 length:408 start_codon:yes stop_codon:yes gene_type:complete